MTKQGTRVEVNTFVRGLITEASPLDFPANASLDEVNFELLRNGTRRRRLGMDLEQGAEFVDATPLNGMYRERVVNTYVWQDADGEGNDYLVVQAGNQLNLHALVGDKALSHPQSLRVSLTLTFGHETIFSYATANGKLVVAGGGTHVAVVKRRKNDNTAVYAGEIPEYESPFNISAYWSIDYKPIRVRDVWGIEEEGAIEKDPTISPTTLTGIHRYNLYNQGWGIPRRNIFGDMVDPIQQYYAHLTKYPSNTESVYNGLQYQPVANNQEPFERMYPHIYLDKLGLDTEAAKGYFIINLHNRGESRRDAVTANGLKYPQIPIGVTYPQDAITTGPSVVGEFAGRVFYSGIEGKASGGDARSPSLSDYVFFSKLIQKDEDITACYQAGDPTSRENSEVVDTDGGYFILSGAKRIMAMAAIGKGFVILAENGVWMVTGGADYGFSATNYQITKITSFGCVSPFSVIEVNDALMYWGENSVYVIGPNQMGDMTAEDFTAETINTYYDNIPLEAKRSVRGLYDPVEKKIRWVYRPAGLFEFDYDTQERSYAVELVYDTLLKSFYQHKVVNYGQWRPTELICPFYAPSVGLRYLTLCLPNDTYRCVYTFSHYRDLDFRDWKTIDTVGIDAKAYMLTGALTAGDSGIAKQSPYLQAHFVRTETGVDAEGVPLNQSSCLMRCQWDWSNDPKSKKFTPLAEIYRYRLPMFSNVGDPYDNGFETIVSKSKLRGKGKALSLYFETSPYKDCQLLGWNLTINGNAIT